MYSVINNIIILKVQTIKSSLKQIPISEYGLFNVTEIVNYLEVAEMLSKQWRRLPKIQRRYILDCERITDRFD